MTATMTFTTIWRRLCWAAGLMCLLAGPARGQELDATAMIRGGLEVIQMIDAGNTGELWDGAGPGAKRRVTRAEFIRQIAQARAPLGAAQQRTWVAVNRQAINNDDPDLAGQYVSVEYETRFANRANASVRELISFHLDRDATWRFIGYVVR